jgi:hypothetical protein
LASTTTKHAGCYGDDCKSEAVKDRTLLQRVTAELRGRRDFSDCDVEQVVRARCSISQPHDVLEDNAAGGPAGPISRRTLAG